MNTKKSKSQQELILEKLSGGTTKKQVIAQGFARSTVYQVAKQLARPDIRPNTSEVAELREEKAILKLKADIEDIESKREKLPARIERLEKQINALAKELPQRTERLERQILIIAERIDALYQHISAIDYIATDSDNKTLAKVFGLGEQETDYSLLEEIKKA